MGAEVGREELRKSIGDKVDALCDAEIMDSFYYTLFPNFHPYLAYNQVNQRFLPYGDRHDMWTTGSVLPDPVQGRAPAAGQDHRARPRPVRGLDAPELGAAAALIAQDEWNLEKVQKGMHTLRKTKPGLTMGVYQHSQVRHFHNVYERYLIWHRRQIEQRRTEWNTSPGPDQALSALAPRNRTSR